MYFFDIFHEFSARPTWTSNSVQKVYTSLFYQAYNVHDINTLCLGIPV